MTTQQIAEAFGVDPAGLELVTIPKLDRADIKLAVDLVGQWDDPAAAQVVATLESCGNELSRWRAVGNRLLALLRAKGYCGTLEGQLSDMLSNKE